MDLSSFRKRTRETESDDEEAAVRRKEPSSTAHSSEQHAAASDPMEPALPVRATATSFAPPPSEDAPGTTPEAPSAPDSGASPAASSASSPAAHKNATDAMELAEETTTVSSPQGPVHAAARFLKDPPRQTAPWLKPKGKKKKQRKEPADVSPSSREATDDSRRQPATPITPSAPAAAVQRATPPAREPTPDGFTLVQSKGDRRRARTLENAALPVDPAVIGTVLFRRAAPGGAFRGALRLALAAALSSRPGLSAVRVNHRRNIVAADTTTQECLEGLLKLTELHAIPVTARLPAECGKSTGFLHGVSGLPAGTDLLGAIESSIPVLSATMDGSTVTIRFAGPVTSEHVRLCKQGFRVRPARPRPVQCGRFGHVPESSQWPTDCISYGKSHAANISCQAVRCRNCRGSHRVDTPACPKWQEERKVATIMVSSTSPLSRRAVRAAVRGKQRQQRSSPPARSYASTLKGPSPAPRPPVPAPRASRSQATQDTAASPAQTTVDQLVANLLLIMEAISTMLPADHPLRPICLQAVACHQPSNHHG
nr:uncharacterized protein LOC126527867 [Dermacentor andersoni]